MRNRLIAILIAIGIGAAIPITAMTSPAVSSPAEEYTTPYFGEDNFPPGCTRDMAISATNICHRMRTDMNGLDSPQVDVLVMVPVSPTAERDMRVMRQSIEMWEAGIDYLAEQMKLDWLAEGMDFHITVDYVPLTNETGEFTTYPIADPEIVVIATNPVGGIGIGIDPVASVFTNDDIVPCHGVRNPFDFEYWESIPGFDNHHGRTGTYVQEDCDGAGGNICFAVNGAIDPAPDVRDVFGLFDLVSHEFGHCLSVGHVGDGAEGRWAQVPPRDIMAYAGSPGFTKCVSTLDVEGVALRMSRYLDVNGDGKVDESDRLLANDQVGDGTVPNPGDPFQVQHPGDHLYASSTGSPWDCPQPDLGLVPGPKTNWTPTPVSTATPVVDLKSPDDGSVSLTGRFNVAGTVERVPLTAPPTATSGSYDDADDDSYTPYTEILDFRVDVTETAVVGTIQLEDLWTRPSAGPASYSLLVDGKRFDSFLLNGVRTWDTEGGDDNGGAYLPAGTSKWDLDADTVTFAIPRTLLASRAVTAPYEVRAHANVADVLILSNKVVDDSAPDSGGGVPVAAPPAADATTAGTSGGGETTGTSQNTALVGGASAPEARTVTFEHKDGNTFYTTDSTFGFLGYVGLGYDQEFTLDVPQSSDIEFTMSWTDKVGGNDLDLYVTGGNADSESKGATTANPEKFLLDDVKGSLQLRVDPYFVADALDGATYTLTATITPGPDADGDGLVDADDLCPAVAGPAPSGCPDGDGDGVADADDACPTVTGSGADGCPLASREHVHVYVNGALAASQDVDAAYGPDTFALTIELPEGTHDLRVDWEDRGKVLATQSVTVTHDTDDDDDGVPNSADACPGSDDRLDKDKDGTPDGCDPDQDGDGDRVVDSSDNCKDVANPDQADLDGDGKGDACDSDIDGDGHSNGKELAHGSDPSDPSSAPGRA